MLAAAPAVQEIEASGHPERFLVEAAARSAARPDYRGVPRPFGKMPAPTKLALEMALHDEQERRALEGLVDATYAQCAIVAAASGLRLGGLGLPGPSERYSIWTHQEEVNRGWE